MKVYHYTCSTCGYDNKNTTAPHDRTLRFCNGRLSDGTWCPDQPVYSYETEEPDLPWMESPMSLDELQAILDKEST